MSDSYKPTGYSTVSPYLVTRNAQKVIDFVCATVDATPLRRYDNDDGTIMHAELNVGGSVVMLADAGGAWQPTPCHLHVYVPDVDATYALALRSGGESVQEPKQNDGEPDRRGGVKDPGGNSWWFATQID